MKPSRRSRFIYRFFVFFGVLGLLAVLYVLSMGPAMRWTVSAICGQAATAENVDRYDVRLDWYGNFYGPLFDFRFWLLRHKFDGFERVFWRYEGLFYPRAIVADGRRVTMGSSAREPDGMNAAELYLRISGDRERKLKAGTELYLLKRREVYLVVLDQTEHEDVVFMLISTTIRHSLDSYVLLEVP